MISTDDAQALLANGGNVLGNDGEKMGKVGQIFLDETSGEAAWVTVKTGVFGGAESFAPLRDARMDGDDVFVPFDKARVKNAPRVEDSDGHLTPDEEDELYAFYAPDLPDADQDQMVPVSRASTGVPDTSTNPSGDPSEADLTMTRSEESLRLDKKTETIGKARLRKYIVTENVTQTVPVSHEEVRIVRESIDENGHADPPSAEISEEVQEVELKGERVVVSKDTVPVERVHMDTTSVTQDQEVAEELRKEQIDTDGGATGAEDAGR